MITKHMDDSGGLDLSSAAGALLAAKVPESLASYWPSGKELRPWASAQRRRYLNFAVKGATWEWRAQA